ncbi:MAG: discoidin domain-containing protein [Bacteroidales bacterium]|nr:discoidin domain-containing protein [Bacteroidales bacterium]
MKNKQKLLYSILLILLFFLLGCQQKTTDLKSLFQSPPEFAKPWVFWYWMHEAFSKEGITADLEAMKEAGIGGAYICTIKPATDPPLYEPVTKTLTPEFCDMLTFAMQEADRLGLKIGMFPSDGFALAGGPWITPEMSMQKVVWTETYVKGNQHFKDSLPQPESFEGYYKDIAVYAFPTIKGSEKNTRTAKPKITTSIEGMDASFLVDEKNTERLKTWDPCWIQYEFNEPFTCRSIVTSIDGNNYQSHRFLVEASDDGINFHCVAQLDAPRHGWQDGDADVTHSIPETTARYFRFSWTSEGSEPGSEDLDAAKWAPRLKIARLELFGSPRIHQYEGKTGEVWRVSNRTPDQQLPNNLCIPDDRIIDLTANFDTNGVLDWEVPEGSWTILRIGHTSNGHTNYTAASGLGLECDKFDPEIVKLQFDKWFGEAIRQAGPELASKALKLFHVDSWECGSQNWSKNFPAEFEKRRGYSIQPYLPVMAGIPVGSADESERFLFDVRQTIAELVVDVFYSTLKELAHEQGCEFTGECVAPTMTSDGMLHYKEVDIPMGEFWHNSPTHDKPNDMLDAISGAHIYGKHIIQAEAFTTLRMAWDEHPGNLKSLGDWAYCMGINKLVYHVYTLNPWLDRKPGMTLDGVGLYFQRDQTWWNPGRAWVEYATRCQALLQQGQPVVDIAVFTGEETPRRAILPDRLVETLPGIFGDEVIERETKRLANVGVPEVESPDGVKHSANMADREDWIDALRGYKYDSFNKDALLSLAKVKDGKIVLPGGASYSLLIIPGSRKMNPDAGLMTPEVANKLYELINDGATVLFTEQPDKSPSLENSEVCDKSVKEVMDKIREAEKIVVQDEKGTNIIIRNIGKGHVIEGPYMAASFTKLGIEKDFVANGNDGSSIKGIAWTHRKEDDFNMYFLSNQDTLEKVMNISLRVSGFQPEIYDPVTGEVLQAGNWSIENGRTILPIKLSANGSVFVILQKKTKLKRDNSGKNWIETDTKLELDGLWRLKFDPGAGGPAEEVIFDSLTEWNHSSDSSIMFYSGTTTYTKQFVWESDNMQTRVWLNMGEVANIGEVWVNDIPCGVAWTYPYQVEVTKALNEGDNNLVIKVTNTWANRLIGDHLLPENKRITNTTAPFRLEGKPLLKAGLLGPVCLIEENRN